MPPAKDIPSNEPQRGRLLRVLGVGFGLAVIIGNTIGAGILRTPGDVAAQLPNPWLFIGVWVIGGLYALLGAISVAELGTMIPRSGGQYVFARRALGDYAGFIVGWSDWLSTCGSASAVSLVIGEYTGVLFPTLAGETKTVVIALAVVITFAVLQWRGIRWGSRVQNATSLVKALAFIALIISVLALQAVIYTYDGWSGVIYFSEEVREPARDIPRALFGGVLAIIGIYLLINLALLYVLPLSQIAGQELAVGTAAQAVFGRYGDTIIRSLTIVSMLSAINAYHLMSTRVLFSMSRDDLFSEKTVKVNKGGTPTLALFVSTMVAVLFIVGGKRFGTVVAALAFFFVANYTMTFISVFVLRRKEPRTARPYRAWGYPWTTGLALIGSVAFLAGAVASDTRNSIYALLLLAVSYPAFLLTRWLAKRH
jgi:APA family basic amino acid/polyamine antiporter